MFGGVDTLEDDFSDVISKAQRGLGLGTAELAARAGLDPSSIRDLRSGQGDRTPLEALALALGLRTEGLIALAEGRYQPLARPPGGCLRLDTAAPMPGYPGMRVNAFLLGPPGGREAILFDTGTDVEAVHRALRETGRSLRAVFLTHGHWDHCECLEALRTIAPEAEFHGPEGVGRGGALSLRRGGESLSVAGLALEVRSTPGHADPSLSYVVRGLATPVAVVGDALFAGSVGGIPPAAYRSGLRVIREQILGLPGETLIAPGHGSLTTVTYEKAHNPFFP
jgi:hydroxyacylglutathione hydrolase